MAGKKKIVFCDTHPDVVSAGQCRECGKNICYNCTVELFGHPLCGSRCASVFLGRNIFKGIFLLLGALFRMLLAPFRVLAKSPPKTAAVVIMAAGLGLCFIAILMLNSRISELKQSVPPVTPILRTAAETAAVAPPRISRPAGGEVTSSTISIEGEAENNRIITLMLNDSVISVQLPRAGTFAFSGIQLSRGDNKLEVRAIHPENGAVSLQTITLTYAPAVPLKPGRDFRRGSLVRKEAALTFDGGASNNAADDILDILKEKNVRCTFFLTGQFIRNFPETVKRIAAEGHEAGNHTWDHPRLTTYAQNRRQQTLPAVSKAMLRQQLEKTAALYKDVTGKTMAALWRAPYGEYNPEILGLAEEAGYRHVGWTLGRGWENTMDTLDWVADTTSGIYYTAEQIAEKVINYGNGRDAGVNGAVVLMHLGTNRKEDFPHKQLSRIIDGLRRRDISLVTVSALMR